MTVAHLVANDGLAGDMLLGALVDAGVPLAEIAQPVAALGMGIELSARTVRIRGVAATKVDVHVPADAPRMPTLDDAESVLDGAGLPAEIDAPARRTLHALAEAEAQAHGTGVREVVFHELGHLDTAADVVGGCAGLVALGIDRLSCGPVAVGGGTVATDHGTLSVPPPAVASLLEGFVIHGGQAGGRAAAEHAAAGHTPPRRELTTPTGAALAAVLADPVEALPLMRLGTSGHGSGDPDRAHPSLLTILVGEPTNTPCEPAAVVEATVDDLSGEHVPVVLDRLRASGAHDAWAVPAVMKKGRPGHTLTALADEAEVAALAEVLIREGGTLGVRWHRVDKLAVPRRWLEAGVDGQTVRVKIGELDGEATVVAAEHDDAAAAAAALGRPVREVAAAAVAAARRELGPRGEADTSHERRSQ